jgi:hypothetical protein
MTFDPTDPKYQVSEAFKPDKASTWAIPEEDDGWVLAHNAIRGEMSMVREALEAVQKRGQGLEEWEVAIITKSIEATFEHVHAHHKNEDDLFVPVLRKRFHYPDKVRPAGQGSQIVCTTT